MKAARISLRESAVPVLVMCCVASILVPLPPMMLDVLLVGNLILSIGLLVAALQSHDPVRLSSLPTVLLLCTLYRLCLNISTTRLILSTGAAGQTVAAFGRFVAGGNPAIGIVIFCVLTFIQFLVIAKGSERVAEVAARFTLDAMPGKQMAIDAEVRSGLYDLETARGKRAELQAESRFYGALDGAMKFVKGDSIAGIVIVLINLCGGIFVGVAMQGHSLSESMLRYTILTIGDGLASQLPSLLNSLAAGIAVTRVVRGEGVSLSGELCQQFLQSSATLFLAGGCACLIGFAPGMPTLPLLGIGAALLLGGSRIPEPAAATRSETANGFAPRISPLLAVMVPSSAALDSRSAEEISDRVRRSLYERAGLLIPSPVFEARQLFEEGECAVLLRGLPVRRFKLESIPVASAQIEEELQRVVDERRTECVDDGHTRRLLDLVEQHAPEIVSSVVPHLLSLTQLTELLRALVREKVSIRPLDYILQSVAESAPRVGAERALVEEVRVTLGAEICRGIMGDRASIEVLTLDPILDLSFASAERDQSPISPVHLAAVIREARRLTPDAVISSKKGRRLLAECFELHGVTVPVIAAEEIRPEIEIIERGRVGVAAEEEDALVVALAA